MIVPRPALSRSRGSDAALNGERDANLRSGYRSSGESWWSVADAEDTTELRFIERLLPRDLANRAVSGRLGEPDAIGEVAFVFVDELEKSFHGRRREFRRSRRELTSSSSATANTGRPSPVIASAYAGTRDSGSDSAGLDDIHSGRSLINVYVSGPWRSRRDETGQRVCTGGHAGNGLRR